MKSVPITIYSSILLINMHYKVSMQFSCHANSYAVDKKSAVITIKDNSQIILFQFSQRCGTWPQRTATEHSLNCSDYLHCPGDRIFVLAFYGREKDRKIKEKEWKKQKKKQRKKEKEKEELYIRFIYFLEQFIVSAVVDIKDRARAPLRLHLLFWVQDQPTAPITCEK